MEGWTKTDLRLGWLLGLALFVALIVALVLFVPAIYYGYFYGSSSAGSLTTPIVTGRVFVAYPANSGRAVNITVLGFQTCAGCYGDTYYTPIPGYNATLVVNEKPAESMLLEKTGTHGGSIGTVFHVFPAPQNYTIYFDLQFTGKLEGSSWPVTVVVS